jgi:uncharacterized protein (TIGR00369 family)
MGEAMPNPVLSGPELERRLGEAFPEEFNADSGLSIVEVWYGGARMRLGFAPNTLRPGGTISGPTLMMLADVSVYVALLASIGWEPLAVTTNLNINFLKRPLLGVLLSDCRLIKLGRLLVVGEVTIRSEGDDDMVAHATSTYSIPPRNNSLGDGNLIPKL